MSSPKRKSKPYYKPYYQKKEEEESAKNTGGGIKTDGKGIGGMGIGQTGGVPSPSTRNVDLAGGLDTKDVGQGRI